MNDFELAVCSEMVFTELPIIDRVRRIDDMGFAVEIWSWHDKDLQALAATGARFTSMTGYLHGDLIDPATADEVVRTAELSSKPLKRLVFSGSICTRRSWWTARRPVRATGRQVRCGRAHCGHWSGSVSLGRRPA